MASVEEDNKIAPEPEPATTTKPKKQKREIEIKKVEEQNKRHVTFSKRKQGLINKVTELSILCEAKTALIIASSNDKFFACGYPTPETVIQQFLSQGNPFSPNQQENQEEAEMVANIETLRLKYEGIQDQLKEEKKKLQALMETNKNGSCSSDWWNLSIDDMSMECLKQFMISLENLKLNIATAREAMIFKSLEPLVSPRRPTLASYPILSECFLEQQVNYDGPFASLKLPQSFDHYYY